MGRRGLRTVKGELGVVDRTLKTGSDPTQPEFHSVVADNLRDAALVGVVVRSQGCEIDFLAASVDPLNAQLWNVVAPRGEIADESGVPANSTDEIGRGSSEFGDAVVEHFGVRALELRDTRGAEHMDKAAAKIARIDDQAAG